MRRFWIAGLLTIATIAFAATPAFALTQTFASNTGLNSGSIFSSSSAYYTITGLNGYSNYSGLPGVYTADGANNRNSAYAYCDTVGCHATESWSGPYPDGPYAVVKNHGGYFSYFSGIVTYQ